MSAGSRIQIYLLRQILRIVRSSWAESYEQPAEAHTRAWGNHDLSHGLRPTVVPPPPNYDFSKTAQDAP